MRERLKNIIRTLVLEAIQQAEPDQETVRTIKFGTGKPFQVVSMGNKAVVYIDPSVKTDQHDESFIKQIRTAIPNSTIMLNGLDSGSKQFRIRIGKIIYQVLVSKNQNIGIVVWKGKEKVENPRKRDGKFLSLTDVSTYLILNKGR